MLKKRQFKIRAEYNERCLVAPSPQLRNRIRERLRSAAAATADFAPGRRMAMQPQNRPGFNDGLIIPGTELPLGTSLRTVRRQAASRAPLRGSVNVIIVLVDFVDAPMTRSADQFRDLFFSTGKIPTGSVREYFAEASDNLITLTGQVVGPYRLPRTLATYAGGGSGIDNPEPNARTMARDAAQARQPRCRLRPLRQRRQRVRGRIRRRSCRSRGEETGNGNHIWSHKWVLAGGAFNADNTKIFALPHGAGGLPHRRLRARAGSPGVWMA